VSSPEEEKLVEFVSFVLDDAQETWARVLSDRYERTRLVLFRDAIQSAC
jgi:predicted metalloprotease